MLRKSTVLLTTLMVTALISPAPATVLYNVIDLGTGGDWSEPYCINNSGQVVGREVITGGNRAFLYNSGTVFHLGGLPGDNWNAAFSINNAGQIVGVSSGGSGDRAVLFDASGAGNNIDLGPGSAKWINESSTIVGYEYDGYNETAYIYDITGAGNNISLGDGFAYFISDLGQIVGRKTLTGTSCHAILFDATGAGNNIDLGTLGGDYSVAKSINASGQIIGHSSLEGGWEWYVTLFDPTGGGNNINLGRGMANSINDSGQIVGTLDIRATLFDISGSGNNIDLNTLIDPLSGWVLKGAFYIHNNGWIVGDGVNPAGQDSSYLLVPVPEPSALRIYVDIKPQSCPNPLNVKSKGVLPVAILGTEDFDVNEIDANSIELAGVGAIRSNYEDAATHLVDPNECECFAEDPDGYTDLILKFDTQSVVTAIGEVNDGDEWVLELTGVLYDDTPIVGEDCVIIRAKPNSKNK